MTLRRNKLAAAMKKHMQIRKDWEIIAKKARERLDKQKQTKQVKEQTEAEIKVGDKVKVCDPWDKSGDPNKYQYGIVTNIFNGRGKDRVPSQMRIKQKDGKSFWTYRSHVTKI